MRPLIVDLDGTLIRNDITHELLVLCIRWAPLSLFLVMFQLLTDRSAAKRWLANRFADHLDIENLPYEQEVLDLIKDHRARGGRTELVSGSDDQIVQRISRHLGIFDHAEGSHPGHNLTSSNKARALQGRYSSDFLYIGNSSQDLNVWKVSAGGFGVNAPDKAYTLKGVGEDQIQVTKLVDRKAGVRPALKALRLHQWAKNLLIFVIPMLFVTSLTEWQIAQAIMGFAAFGLMASGTYILNDLFDIQDDRSHQTKMRRPLAAGTLSVTTAVLMMMILIVASVLIAVAIAPAFLLVLLVYAVTTILYSFRLKRIAIIDVFVLAVLFTIRVVAGGVIVGHLPTAWLIICVGFVFLSLALAKRYVEVQKLDGSGAAAGRGYRASDRTFLITFGAATSVAAILALIVYGVLEETRAIENVWVVMSIAPLIFIWMMRLWMTAARGELDDDPVLFAVKDIPSLCALSAVGLLILVDGFSEHLPLSAIALFQ